MGVISYPCRGPGTLWHPKVIVIKQHWVRVLRSGRPSTKCCEQTLCHLPIIFSTIIRSSGPPRLKRLYQIRRWNIDMENLMNVTPAIQGYFSSNFRFRLSDVHPTAAQCMFDIMSNLTGHYPARDGSATQSTWCYVRKYVPVNFLRISNENVKYKLVKSPYILSMSWTAVEIITKNGGRLVLLPPPLEVNRSREQRFHASTESGNLGWCNW